jgi:hypothetical protein
MRQQKHFEERSEHRTLTTTPSIYNGLQNHPKPDIPSTIKGAKMPPCVFPQNQYNSIREQSGLTRVPVLGFSSPLLEAKTEYTRIDAEKGNMGAA